MVDTSQSVTAAKRAAGYLAADRVKDGMVIGLGTGSTVLYMMERLSKKIHDDSIHVSGVPTSYQTAIRAREFQIPLTTLDDNPVLDLAIDGADQVDPQLRLIKGRGAAHTREKCVAAAALHFIVVADEAKMVPALCGPVPVEVIPFAIQPVLAHLRELGGDPIIREGVKKDGPVITDNGNFILDCRFDTIPCPEDLEKRLAMIPGIVESGLFCTFADKTTVIVGDEKKCRVINSPDIIS